MKHLTIFFSVTLLALSSQAQETSVNPGINDSFEDPSPKAFVERFEKEGREVYDNREAIVQKLGLKPGMVVADVGAGTGLFTRLLAPEVGEKGKVYAVDIARTFVNHTVMSSRARGLNQVEGIICEPDDAKLPANSIDIVFICDTYHHFEFPQKTMRSILKALKPEGRVYLLDFERIEGVSSDWILSHVRAGKDVVLKELESAGFEVEEDFELFDENYFIKLRRS